MYLNIDEKALEKTKEKARKDAISEMGEDSGKYSLLYDNTKDTIEETEIDDDKIKVSVSNDLGFFFIEIPIDTFLLEQILSFSIKKMNKIKSLLETLK